MEDKIQEFIRSQKEDGFGYTTVVRLKPEIINMNPSEKVFVLHEADLKEDVNLFHFVYKIHYFNPEGDEISDQVGASVKNFTINTQMEIAERTFPDFKPVLIPKLDDEGNLVLNEEGNEVLEVKRGNAIKLLKKWSTMIPLPTLIEYYIHDRDDDGLFNR